MKLSNTNTRIIVSIIAMPIIITGCLSGGYSFLFISFVIALLAFYEFKTMSDKKGIFISLPFGLLCAASLVYSGYRPELSNNVLIPVIVFSIVLSEMFKNKGSAISNIGASLLGILYIGLSIQSLVRIRELFAGADYVRGGYLIVTTLATIWVCDSAAYFGGLRFGKHRLFLRVSPKKSWEGAIFGFVFSIISVVLAKYFFLSFLSWLNAIMLGLIIGIFGQVGDLAESWLKRDAGVKDSSNIIPGHGGIFDRFDSLIAVAPMVYGYLYFFIKN